MIQLVTDSSDPVFHLGLLLHEIVERMTAVKFYMYEVDILEVSPIKAMK